MNVFEDGVLSGCGEYGMKFAGGEVTVSRCVFSIAATATADVFVSRTAAWARFIANYHETVCPTAYLFEPTSTGNIRPRATLSLSVRVVHQRIASPQRIIDFQQDGHLSLVTCQFEGIAGQNQAEVCLAPPDMGYTDLGLIQDIGCRYGNGAHAVVNPVNGAYSSLYSNSSPSMPPPGPILGEHLTTYTRLRVHNGSVQLQDNSLFDGTSQVSKGTELTSYLGQLFVTSTDTRAGGYLLVVRNNDTFGFSVNHAGGPFFFNDTATTETKPTVVGSRSGNAALADLRTKLASFGLINDGTTPRKPGADDRPEFGQSGQEWPRGGSTGRGLPIDDPECFAAAFTCQTLMQESMRARSSVCRQQRERNGPRSSRSCVFGGARRCEVDSTADLDRIEVPRWRLKNAPATWCCWKIFRRR